MPSPLLSPPGGHRPKTPLPLPSEQVESFQSGPLVSANLPLEIASLLAAHNLTAATVGLPLSVSCGLEPSSAASIVTSAPGLSFLSSASSPPLLATSIATTDMVSAGHPAEASEIMAASAASYFGQHDSKALFSTRTQVPNVDMKEPMECDAKIAKVGNILS
ncbi:unnamed protein product [Protopolystoma xenopodis]|uniref:Uncharacterized protein n=1 Tax=Protopolystoma xenopodis TaxID=117903 RepID=A0A3S5CE96_9PLAT|nr:unnamed protein product [Protopolystoma xenopodis]